LFLEDDPQMQDLVRSALEPEYKVTGVLNPDGIISKIAELKPDIVLTDYRMPKLHTEEFLSQMRIHHPATPVVMVTGFMDNDSMLAAIRQNVFDFISKPFQVTELQRVLANACDVAKERSLVLETILKAKNSLGAATTLQVLRSLQASGFQKLSVKAFETLERQVLSRSS